MRTKCMLHALSILQHVSAQHIWHHQGLFVVVVVVVVVVVIITFSKNPLYNRGMNTQLCNHIHSKIQARAHKMFKT